MNYWSKLINDSEFWELLSSISDYRRLESGDPLSLMNYFISCEKDDKKVLDIALYPPGMWRDDPVAPSYRLCFFEPNGGKRHASGDDNFKGTGIKEAIRRVIDDLDRQ